MGESIGALIEYETNLLSKSWHKVDKVKFEKW